MNWTIAEAIVGVGILLALYYCLVFVPRRRGRREALRVRKEIELERIQRLLGAYRVGITIRTRDGGKRCNLESFVIGLLTGQSIRVHAVPDDKVAEIRGGRLPSDSNWDLVLVGTYWTDVGDLRRYYVCDVRVYGEGGQILAAAMVEQSTSPGSSDVRQLTHETALLLAEATQRLDTARTASE